MIPGQRITLNREPVGSITYGHWSDDREGAFVEPPGVGYSDYSGSMIERSNYEAFIEAFAEHEDVEWFRVHGGHGTTGVIVRFDADERVPEIGEFFDSLEGYPSIDDTRLSRLEMEAIDEAWVEGRQDFVRRMVKLDSRLGDVLEDAADSTIDEIYHAVAQAADENPYVEDAVGSVSFSPYFRILDRVNKADEDALLVAVDLASVVERHPGAGQSPLEYLFQELGSGWRPERRMPAFYYALLEFNPQAARAIGTMPKAAEFALSWADQSLRDALEEYDPAGPKIVVIAERMAQELPRDATLLMILADAIEEAPFISDEEGFDFSRIFARMRQGWS